MQPNLKVRHVTTLDFSFRCPLKYIAVKKILSASEPNDEGDSVFFDSYKYHRILAKAKGVKQKAKDYNFEFSFQALSGGHLPDYFPRVPQLLDILSSISEKLLFECSVSFVFRKNLKPKSIIQLPIIYSPDSNIPVDKVQGMHLVKETGQERRYDIYIDSPEDGVLTLNIDFNYLSIFETSLPDKILDSAEFVANSIVLKGKSNGS
jgi:hypothetical protein